MAKKVSGGDSASKNVKKNNRRKMVTTIGKSKFSRPNKKKCNQKRGVKKYRGQGR